MRSEEERVGGVNVRKWRSSEIAAIVSIVVVANATAAPNKDPSIRPADAQRPGPTTSAPTTPASPRCGE